MLTYCTNIHPGESWSDVFTSLRVHVPAVRRAVSPDAPFPLGLRLSASAAAGIGEEEESLFREWCRSNSCFVATINGFPYGTFHGAPVKRGAYAPSWAAPERLAYTSRLADLLAGWLPPEVPGSISTVPLACRGDVGASEWPQMRRNVLQAAEHLRRLREETGKTVVLSFEPEPGCLLETAGDGVRFFDVLEAPAELLPHLGICLDACHEAVQFRDPAASLKSLIDAGVPVGKVQLSSAPVAGSADEAAAFADAVYVHQTCVREPGAPLRRFRDLPEALAAAPRGEWRMHYHLPLVLENCRTTAGGLPELLRAARGILVETEVYTWDVLPLRFRAGSVTDCIVRDLLWAGGAA